MKRQNSYILFIITFFVPLFLQSQVISTTCHEVVLPLQIADGESISIYKDTLIFEENFEHFLSDQIDGSTPIVGTSSLQILPMSLTQKPYCRAKEITVKYDSTRNQYYCTLGQGSCFATPKLNIPENSILKVTINTSSKATRSLLINNDTVEIKKKGYTNIEIPLQATEEVIITHIHGGEINICNISITTPREEVASENYTVDNNTLRIHNLSPATKYYIEINNPTTADTRTYSFETKRHIEQLDTRIQDSTSVKLHWTNNSEQTNPRIQVYKVDNCTQDLIFSRVATKSAEYGLEIFNGTGKDICLKDYKIRFLDLGRNVSPNNIDYLFSSKDTIHKDSYIMICGRLSYLNTYNNIVYPIKFRLSIQGGQNACLLLKKDISGEYRDTVDLFGRIIQGTESANLSYQNKILTRKGNITTGVKHNPQNTPVYNDSSIGEWNVVAFDSVALNTDSLRHTPNNPATYTLVKDTMLTANQNEILLSGLVPRSLYRCIMTIGQDTVAIHSFSSGNTIRSINSGNWYDVNTWENAHMPQPTDKVIIQKGHKINIPQEVNAECGELVLQSDYSTALADTNKAELQTQGILKTGKVSIEATFSAYTANTNGWHLFGLPINANDLHTEQIAACFQRSPEDDLYCLDEATYSWIPYSASIENPAFFTNTNGYLVAYKNNKTLTFNGTPLLQDNIHLLNNATFTPTKGNGCHLTCNPYPFSVHITNFEQNNIDGFWLLDPLTGAYIASDNNAPEEFAIPPFGGFMTKVSSPTNKLILHKNEQTQSKTCGKPILGRLCFLLCSDKGEDKAKIYVRSDATTAYDKYDTYKLFSVGTAPDLWFNIANNNLSVAAIGNKSDSILLQLNVLNKTNAPLRLQLSETNDSFNEVILREHGTDSLLCNFKATDTYTINYNAGNKGMKFDLLLKWKAPNEPATQNEDLKISQHGRTVKIDAPQTVDHLTAFDMQGRTIAETNGNTITLPTGGCFVLKIISQTKEYTTKVITL